MNNTNTNDNKSYIEWDEYFMNIAILASLRSKDTTKVGSVLVLNNKIVGVGFNGFPSGVDETLFPKTREGKWIDTKYPYTIHSELNAIINSTIHDITGASLYVNLFPCNECAKIIVQKKIKEVIYLSDKYHDVDAYIASRKIFNAANIKTRKYEGNILVKCIQ